MSYESTLEYIHRVDWRGSKPGLERTQELLMKLGNPEKKLKFVHVAGTNGKGSTAACIASILRKAGYKTGLYTSPYIIRFNERMQIDGEQIADDELERLTDEIKPYVESLADKPTEFEMITALAMRFFALNECDIVVLEVGLGGELDSTNVIEVPECAVITAIGLDHTAVLGETLAEIASAKAGIIKAGGEVAVYGGEKEVEDVFEKKCAEVGANLVRADFSRLNIRGFDLGAAHFDFAPYVNIDLPLVGTYQPRNAALAVTAVECMRKKGWNISDENIVDGLNSVYWPGRFEVLRHDPVFVLDGAHNPHGMVATIDSLRQHFKDQKLVFIIGCMADKDVSGMMGMLAPMAKAFFTVQPHNPRAMSSEQLAEIVGSFGVHAEALPTIEEGVNAAFRFADKSDTICALGSLYFSGDIRDAVAAIKD